MCDDQSERGVTRRVGLTLRTMNAFRLVFAFVALVYPVAAADVARPLDLVLVLDSSASMNQNDPRRTVLTSAASLIERLGPDDGAGLVLFGGSATAPVELAPVADATQHKALLKAIADVHYDEKLSDFGAGVERALYELRIHGRPDARLAIVFFSDGILDTGSEASNAERTTWLTTDLLEEAKRRRVRIFAVAYSEQADYVLIRKMAETAGGEYYRATDSAEIGSVFATISSQLSEPASPAPTATTTPTLASDPVVPEDPSRVPDPWTLTAVFAILGMIAATVVFFEKRRRRADTSNSNAHVPGASDVSKATDRAVSLVPAALVAFKTGERVPITAAAFTVGRDETSDVVLPSDLVSLNHARIEFRDRQYVVVDLRSTNGTFVNGNRIDTPTVLNDGDLVDFDEFRYRFVGGTSGAHGTVVRMSAVERTNVRLKPIQPLAAPDHDAVRHHPDLIETHAGTHQIVYCEVHADQCAVAHCVRCGTAGCGECVSITGEGPICSKCAASPFPRTMG